MKRINTKLIATLGVFGALAIVLALLIHFPIFPAAPYLEYNPADIPIYLVSFMYGPLCGIILTVIVGFIQGFTVSAGSGIIGVAMHILATGSYSLVAGIIYKKNRTMKGAVIAIVVGALVSVAVMVLWNIILTPLYTGMPRAAVLKMILPIILPFNLIKVAINSVITFILYKQTKKLIGFIWQKTDSSIEKRRSKKSEQSLSDTETEQIDNNTKDGEDE